MYIIRSSILLLCTSLMLIVISPMAIASEPSRTSDRSIGLRTAMGAIFNDDHIQREALSVHLRAAAMLPEQRYQFLKAWTLPSGDHSTLRMQIDFSQAYPAPRPVNMAFPEGRMVPSGADLICPAIDLIAVATELNRLEEVQSAVDAWPAIDGGERKAKAAFLALVAIAQRDFSTANAILLQSLELAATVPITEAERGPEAAIVWVGEQHPETQELAYDMVTLLSNDVQSGRGPYSERWCRHVYAKKQSADATQRLGRERQIDTDQSMPLKNWIPFSRMTAASRGSGYPLSIWKMVRGQATHLSGHDHDYLCYASPLPGNVSVEADLSTFSFREIQLGYGAIWAGCVYDLKRCNHGTFRYDNDFLPIDPPLSEMFDSMRVRLNVQDQTRSTFVNGRPIFQSKHPPGSDPWLTIHSGWPANGTVKNLRITGDPLIPDQLELLTTSDLIDWLPYFDESVGSAVDDWHLSPRTTPSVNGVEQFGGELKGQHRPDLSGTYAERLLRYHRPVAEDGTIDYEFFYEPGRILVHPALDRLCFFLNPDRVGIHWITDGRFDNTEFAPGNLVVDSPVVLGPNPLPLKANEWNSLSLTIRGDMVNVELNGKHVYSRVLEATNLRTFGFFHYADQTEARVRNVRWRGDWPRNLPEPSKQDLADDRLDQVFSLTAKLPVVLQHDFRQSFPRDKFSVAAISGSSTFKQESSGLRMLLPSGNSAYDGMTSPLRVSGDFEITLDISEFESSVEDGGIGNVQLLVTFADSRSTECNLVRAHNSLSGNRDEHRVQTTVSEARKDGVQQLFWGALAEEATSGRMRVARSGSQVYLLFAENDSTEFRLLHEEHVGPEDASMRVVIGRHLSGKTSVLLKSLIVRAESASGLPETPWATIEQLDQQRTKLAATSRFDLTTTIATKGTAGLKGIRIGGAAKAEVSRDHDGLTMVVPGADQWTGASLVPRTGFKGDFDVSLEFEVLNLEPAAINDGSGVMLQLELKDPLNSLIEVRYMMGHDGQRRADTLLRQKKPDGSVEYKMLQSMPADQVSGLRLSRRGDLIYQLYRESEEFAPVVLGAINITADDIPEGAVRAFVHTGGANRKSVVRFKSMTVDAETIDRK